MLLKENWLEELQSCILFSGYTKDELERLLEGLTYTLNPYEQAEVIAIEESPCTQIGIILAGSVEVQKLHGSGSGVIMERLLPQEIFGEVIIFSQHATYPATIVAGDAAVILFISKDAILNLCANEQKFLQNFMALLSNKILMLNRKVKRLAYPTIRQKIADYLIECSQSTADLRIQLPFTKKEWSEHLAIPRPSLSRELGKMQADGLIQMDQSIIHILQWERLRSLL